LQGQGDLRLNDRVAPQLNAFDQAIAQARSAEACWQALERLAAEIAGHKLFTVMTVDLAADLARRVYTNDTAAYPVSGTKPITHDRWFEIVHGQKQTFVANTLAEIATVFPDHEKIGALGCGSVVNLPVVLGGQLAATINMLHEAGYYTSARVAEIEGTLSIPSRLALLAARSLS
jgi:hypothetical protein